MEGSYPKEWDELIGPIPAHAVFDLASKWVFKSFLEDESPAFLCIGIIPRKRTGSATPSHVAMHEWVSDPINKTFINSVQTIAWDSYEDIISECEKVAKERFGKMNIPFYSIACHKLNKKISHMAYGVLRTEQFVFYAFAPYGVKDESVDTVRMKCLFFELLYVICRIIAPNSDFAFDLVQNWPSQFGGDLKLPYKLRAQCVAHAEKALGGRQFGSVIVWRHL